MLSNFWMCSFFLDNILYNSNEQFFQHKRAGRAGKQSIAIQILATADPIEQKHLGKQTGLSDEHWDSQQCMKRGAIAKFTQNVDLFKHLQDTKGHRLLHTNKYDTEWATGTALTEKDVLTKLNPGKNILGKILEDIRDNDLARPSSNPNPTGSIIMPQPTSVTFPPTNSRPLGLGLGFMDGQMDIAPPYSVASASDVDNK